jgi:hypothetical protein
VTRLKHSSYVIVRATALLLSLIPLGARSSQDARPLYELEEVQVLGTRLKLVELRAAIIETEDQFYGLLNQLLDDPEMRVMCNAGPPLGSHLHKRVCGPQFIATAKAEYARAWIQELTLQATATDTVRISGSFADPVSPGAAIGPNEIVFHRKVNALLESNSTLRDLATRRAMLAILLKAAQKARFKGQK